MISRHAMLIPIKYYIINEADPDPGTRSPAIVADDRRPEKRLKLCGDPSENGAKRIRDF